MFPIGWREKHARGTLSALVSCILHTVLFICLALTYFAADHPAPLTMVLQGAMAGADEVALEYSDSLEVELPKGDDLSTPSPAMNTDFELNVQAQLTSVSQSADASLATALASTSRSGGGGVSGGGGGTASDLEKLGANFFGSYAVGEKFVFVLDSSKSMTGERWTYACQELMDSVSRLQPNQKFFVICFDDKTTCLFNTPVARIKFQENTAEIRAKLKRWLAVRKLGPGTYPAQAVTLAMQMHPDAIFMLSDGELRDDTISVLRSINGFSTERRQIPIHTVHLMSMEGRESLQVIATENAGTFTPIQGRGSF